MNDLDRMADILSRGNIWFTIRNWCSKETGETGKFMDVKQGDCDIYIEFDKNGMVIEGYD